MEKDMEIKACYVHPLSVRSEFFNQYKSNFNENYAKISSTYFLPFL